jgi:uncharacterized protein YbjT (DUF2867 family)
MSVILVTGAAGNVGRHIVRRLIKMADSGGWHHAEADHDRAAADRGHPLSQGSVSTPAGV